MEIRNKEFFMQNATKLAPVLLGKILCRKLKTGEILKACITETECYLGETDSASHAYKRKTERNKVMFEKGGKAYVYLCYGVHHMLNIVSGEKEKAQAVLIRGVKGYEGPGKLTKFFKIEQDLNGEDLCKSKKVWLEEGEMLVEYKKLKRVGIDYALPIDRNRLWRFKIKET